MIEELIACAGESPVYLVGGVVRDALAGAATFSYDLDFLVDGDASLLASVVARRFHTVERTFARFLTAKVAFEYRDTNLEVDFVSARREYYTQPGALPTVERGTLREDLLRRDFSINTLALPLAEFGRQLRTKVWPSNLEDRLIDWTGGIEDLRAGRVKILHSASFEDDPTRLFRAVRYASRIDGQLETHTLERARACVESGGLWTISAVRRVQEIERIFREPKVVDILLRAKELNLLDSTPLRLVSNWEAFFERAGAVGSSRPSSDRLMLDAYDCSTPTQRDGLFKEFGYGPKRLKRMELAQSTIAVADRNVGVKKGES